MLEKVAKPLIKDLGVIDYELCLSQMHEFIANRNLMQLDEIWLLQHNAVFTMGPTSSRDDIIFYDHDIPIVKTDRGGKITFHGPGQIIIYLLLDMKRLRLTIKQIVAVLSAAVVDLLSIYGIKSYISSSNPGVYIDKNYNNKIASIGMKINRKGFLYHGISFNVDIDKKCFSYINPCGQPGLNVINFFDLVLDENLTIDSLGGLLVDIIVGILYDKDSR